MSARRLHRDSTAFLLVDLQERLVPAMHRHEALVRRATRLIEGAFAMHCPVLVTEQYRKGLGQTVGPLEKLIGGARCVEEKTCFTACVDPVMQHLRRLEVKSVVVSGVEAHVCVLQTCLDLLEAGYVPAVVVDATSSRRPEDKQVAMARLTQAGVLPVTVESVLMELLRDASDPCFRAVLKLIK